ncbi:NADPH quinone reductase [Lacticaseibacillus zeae DSM 20178 = KCTC 3804]|uniref:NADPH quinone reductase n=1 Tax=Lacticaseibacillus zeae DSM 20178 = KCTC 3804 TaxID=1423816 RepID=A0A0R1EJJ6_LACZE|nr:MULTISPECIES: zinc-binding dehydrogenase [Lacticaseibacillus]KLI74609.1 alcohol dehydrogenase [Lacticaseibacillus casei]KRK09629.1 NADPH quinone reductase [Lacticaseibacillus zeae DSM 20178 = KCTC 3804]OLS06325.1 alcohol dehydrogenase [Lacticaseibacillus casei]QVI32443.1 zinc-binding dehydrogenase [Lacticaseibacillus zeae]
MKALFFKTFGDANVLQYGTLPDPQIGSEDLLVQTHYIGLNFADIYRRRGTYHLEPHTPFIDGYEGLGQIVAIGSDVTTFTLGERVLFVDVPFANASLVRVPRDHAIRVPSAIDDKTAASIGLQGLTADFLAHDLARNHVGDRVLIHGISGGVGQLLAQMLIADGVQVAGVTSTLAKREIALKLGASRVFLRHSDWAEHERGHFDTVFDGVGVTLPLSFDLVGHRGSVVFYGMAGGLPPKIDAVKLLNQSKSLLTGDLWDYLTSFEARQTRSTRLFRYVLNGAIKVQPPTILPLADGRKAHELLESGKSTGKILLESGSFS